MKDAGQVILTTPLEGLANELCEVVKLFYRIDGFFVNPDAARRGEARGGFFSCDPAPF